MGGVKGGDGGVGGEVIVYRCDLQLCEACLYVTALSRVKCVCDKCSQYCSIPPRQLTAPPGTT